MTNGVIESVDWKAFISIVVILTTIGLILWSKDRKISKLEEAKREADLDHIEEANDLRDDQSLVDRVNDYWRRFTGRPPGKDS